MAFRAGSQRYRAICLDFGLIAESTESLLDAQKRLADLIQERRHDRGGLARWKRLQLRLTVALRGMAVLAGCDEVARWTEEFCC